MHRRMFSKILYFIQYGVHWAQKNHILKYQNKLETLVLKISRSKFDLDLF